MENTTQGHGARSATLKVLAALVVAGGAATLLLNQRVTAPGKATALQARLELAAGEVKVGSGGKLQPAISGAPLAQDVTVASGPGARALLRLSDGSSVFLRDGTTINLAASGVELQDGEVWMDAPPTDRKALVHKAGEVTVSGADAGFSWRRSKDDVSVYVARGLVTLSGPGGRVEVNAGQRGTVAGAAAPAVKGVTFFEDWTGGMADHRAVAGLAGAGAGTIYGVDTGAAPGTPSRTLEISRQAIRAVIRDGLAETEVDQTFFNPHPRNVEGWFWFTVPPGASVTGFALETNGQLVEGELIERQQASAQYASAVQSGHQPALLEWMDANTFRARIYPVPANGTRRTVVRYLQRLPLLDGTVRFVHPLQSRDPVRIGEFSLSVDLGDAGPSMVISTLEDARVEDGGRRVTMRRSGFKPVADFQLEARLSTPVPPVRISRYTGGGDAADYLMARYVPDVPWDSLGAQNADVVLVVDTSAGGDDAARQLKAATAEAVLRALSSGDRFALLALDVKPTVLHPKEGLAKAEEAEITAALERLSEHPAGGATDLAAQFDVALSLLHGTEQPAVIYVGDGHATSGDLTGEQLAARLGRSLATSRARFFTVAVGGDANLPLLSELARTGGGQMFSLDEAEQTTQRALTLAAAVKTPTITDFDLDLGAGLDEVFVSSNGKVSRGEEVMLLARSHHDIPRTVKVKGRLAGKPFVREHPVTFSTSVATALVPRLWAAESVRRLLGTMGEEGGVRGKIVAVGVEYGLMTPFTSFIALESEHAYRQQGIPRRNSPLRGVRLSALTPVMERVELDRLGLLTAGTVAFGCSRDRAPQGDRAVGRMAKMEATNSEPAPAAAAPASPPPEPQMEMDRRADGPGDGEALMAALGGAGGGGPRSAIGKDDPAAAAFGYAVAKEVMAEKKAVRDEGGMRVANAMRQRPAGRPTSQSQPTPVVAPVPPKNVLPQLRTCSDVARRPLWDRAIVWERKARQAASGGGYALVNVYENARAACEIPDWRAESRLLSILQRHIMDGGTATVVLGHFAGRVEAQRFLARMVLRRAVDMALVAAAQRAVLGDGVDWEALDLETARLPNDEERLKRVRAAVAKAPQDARGVLRLCQLLIATSHADEALIQARRLREQGLLNPALTRQLGDLLARQGLTEDAQRTYSEIVEFDAGSPASRALLGDVYLAHGWYQAAYLQYRTLVDANPQDFTAQLMLASAAAGEGRVDEAFRLERRVAEAEGTPGADDPRRWARLWSAARLARLLVNPPKDEGDPKKLAEGLQRRLKELQVFQGPGAMVLVTWEDPAVNVAVGLRGKPAESSGGETVDASRVGLAGVVLPAQDADSAVDVSLRAPLRDPLRFTRHTLRFDGKVFKVDVEQTQLAAGKTTVAL